VAQAYADFLKSEHKDTALVVVGFDRRFLSEYFAQHAAEIMSGNGFRVAMFSEAAPTPVISWAVKNLGAAGGIVITASHNPATFNGFKIKAPWGGSADSETTAKVEKLVDVNAPRQTEILSVESSLLNGAIATYREQIANYVDLERIRAAAGTVIVDPMHGSGRHLG
jgi:phosphomannomutase